MRLARRTNLMLLAAALLLAATAGGAAAATLDMNETTFRSSWREFTFTVSGISISCPVTLEGTFIPGSLGTIAKVAGRTMGRVTTASVGTCTGGTVRALTETLPWAVNYSSFAGTLPNITSVTANLIGASFLVSQRLLGLECLGRTEASHPIGLRFERSEAAVITAARLNEALTIPCGAFSGSVRGSGSVSDAGSSTALELFLEEPPLFFGGTERTGPDNIVMREPVGIGQSVVKNYNLNAEAHDIRVSKDGGANPELFNLLTGASEDCSKAGQRLRPNQGSTCTVRVEYLGRPEQREAEMRVRIEGLIGNNPAPGRTHIGVFADR